MAPNWGESRYRSLSNDTDLKQALADGFKLVDVSDPESAADVWPKRMVHPGYAIAHRPISTPEILNDLAIGLAVLNPFANE